MTTYLSDSEYESYGMEPSTAESLVAAASTLINTYCRRPTFAIFQYIERIRIAPERNNLRLTYLPLAIAQGNNSPLISGRARYAMPRRGEETTLSDMLLQIASAYQLPGTWIDVDVSTFDYFAETGEVTWLGNPLGLAFDEMELTYTAGFAQVPDPIKFACVQIVRNAQANPALNVKAGTLNQMRLEYFSDTLLDATVQTMLAPFAAQKVA
jgi:hypothetical protein